MKKREKVESSFPTDPSVVAWWLHKCNLLGDVSGLNQDQRSLRCFCIFKHRKKGGARCLHALARPPLHMCKNKGRPAQFTSSSRPSAPGAASFLLGTAMRSLSPAPTSVNTTSRPSFLPLRARTLGGTPRFMAHKMTMRRSCSRGLARHPRLLRWPLAPQR